MLTKERFSPEFDYMALFFDFEKTYYWKIVPWAGNIRGPESEIWRFTFKKDYVPRFYIQLNCVPSEIVWDQLHH